jgi:hypothetical protein
VTRRQLLLSPAAAALAQPQSTSLDRYFLPVLEGYVRNCRRTSPSWAVCDFEDGLILKNSVARSGKTYDSVTRMLPAIAAWIAGGRSEQAAGVNLIEVLADTFRNATNPDHSDYWEASPAERQNQRQVEASIVAWSLWLVADRVLPRLSAVQRRNVQEWLASNTRVPVRRNNWAWFTAVNQAARLALSAKWNEFSGDERWMLADLEVLDKMAAPGNDGWYSDSLAEPVYDYYNFWVFASHFLYWNRLAGNRHREWSRRFGDRIRRFLMTAPEFFGSNGSHVLFGRSLIYRWGVITPLVLAYTQGLWPHSPGLLRRIVRGNLEYLWSIGAFDSARGKLRESLTPDGTRDICESYIDNGHPYWGMQAFALFLIPRADRFWIDREEPLPVERSSFVRRFEGPRFLLIGNRESGEVRWVHAVNGHHEPDYRDKYTKLSYSTHFPFSITKEKGRATWDGALVFRDPSTGELAGRRGIVSARLTATGIEREWFAELGGRRIRVTTELSFREGVERRIHVVEAPEGTEILEGSLALGVPPGSALEDRQEKGTRSISVPGSGGISVTAVAGFTKVTVEEQIGLNIVHRRAVVLTLHTTAGAAPLRLESLHRVTV